MKYLIVIMMLVLAGCSYNSAPVVYTAVLDEGIIVVCNRASIYNCGMELSDCEVVSEISKGYSLSAVYCVRNVVQETK